MTVGPGNNVCQNCNTPYSQEHRFCNICGTRIPVPQDQQESAVSDDDIPIQDTKECPFCAEFISKEAAKCNHCGSILHQANKTYTRQQDVRAYTQPTYQQQQPPPPTDPPQTVIIMAPKNSQPQTVMISDRIFKPDVDPVLMTFLSTCCLTGLGQIVMGQTGKGIVIILMSTGLACCTLGFSLWITWPLMIIDTYCIASKLKNGRTIGKWECF